MSVIIAGDFNKNDIIEISGTMSIMERKFHNIKSVEGLIEEVEHHRRKTASIDKYDLVGDCIDIIKEYCEVK